MPFVPVPDVALVEVRMQLDFQQVENTLYFRKSGGWLGANLAVLAQDVIDWWAANIRPLCSTSVKLVEVTCTDLTSDVGPSVSVSPAALTTGADSNEVLPSNVSLAVSFRTEGRGRSSRGRNYFVGICDDFVAGNTVTDPFVEDLRLAYEAIGFGGSFTDDAIWVVVSRFHDNAPRVEGISQQIVAVVVTDPTVDSQRRRLPGRGR